MDRVRLGSRGGPGAGGEYGDANDALMAGADVKNDPAVSSRIAGLIIGGQALGTIAGGDHFGVVAQGVGAVSIGGSLLVLKAGKGNDDLAVGITGDFCVNEV